MTGAIAPLTGFSGWARGDLLVIVLLVLGAILLTRLANWVRGRVIKQIDAHASEADELVRSESLFGNSWLWQDRQPGQGARDAGHARRGLASLTQRYMLLL